MLVSHDVVLCGRKVAGLPVYLSFSLPIQRTAVYETPENEKV